MSLKNYCTSCGKATEFTTVVPSFCAYCGVSFNNSVAKRDIIPPIVATEDEIDDPNIPIPKIDKLDVTIENPQSKLTFGHLAVQKPPTEKFERPKPPKLSKKKFMEQWRAEAGPGNRGSSVQIGSNE